jgi:hypothetical protein
MVGLTEECHPWSATLPVLGTFLVQVMGDVVPTIFSPPEFYTIVSGSI